MYVQMNTSIRLRVIHILAHQTPTLPVDYELNGLEKRQTHHIWLLGTRSKCAIAILRPECLNKYDRFEKSIDWYTMKDLLQFT